MNTRCKDVFRGKVVNKRLTVNTGVDEFPRFVVKYLIDNYCTEENFRDDLQQVIKHLRENFVHGAEAEKIRHQIRETRNHNIIANLEVRLQETKDKYWGTIGAINESFVNVTKSLVRQYPMLLSDGMWGTITLTYDETEVHGKKIRPFQVTEFTPFQISVINLNEYIEKRKQFDAGEWLDFLINSIGLNPEPMTRREKLLYLWRLRQRETIAQDGMHVGVSARSSSFRCQETQQDSLTAAQACLEQLEADRTPRTPPDPNLTHKIGGRQIHQGTDWSRRAHPSGFEFQRIVKDQFLW